MTGLAQEKEKKKCQGVLFLSMAVKEDVSEKVTFE